MFLWIFIIFLVLLIAFIISNRIHIDWKSLFKLGFSKKDEHFRFILLYWKTTEKVKPIQRLSSA